MVQSMKGGAGKSSSKEFQSGHPIKVPFPLHWVAPCRTPRRRPKSTLEHSPTTAASTVVLPCTSALESVKSGKLTGVTSQEELERYAATQELLARAQSADEASQVSRLSHSDSIEALAALERIPSSTNDVPSAAERSSSPGENHKRRSFRGLRKGPPKIFEKIGNALKGIEKAMFPHKPESLRSKVPALSVTPKVRGGVLLRGCTDDDEHMQVVRQSIAIMKQLRGKEGLQAMGLVYRPVPVEDNAEQNGRTTRQPEEPEHSAPQAPFTAATADESVPPKTDGEQIDEQPLEVMNRLFHVESNTMITMKNRKEFIADGDMYDQVARLCQEYAQEVMIEEGDLEWVTVCEAGNNPEPIRALVSATLAKNEEILGMAPTLLIATGNGKVRAGIFSRQHLITTGMECSTAIPVVREACKRGMICVLLDPNVHGDRLGMATFEKSMARVFRRLESNETTPADRPPLVNSDLFVLSHSQSGAQFARYLLDKSNLYVPHIRAVAFTDATHNIQWTRDNRDLNHLLQSDRSVYFKVSKESTNDLSLKPLKTTGMVVDTDHFWKHRFGSVATRCAGTTEHSLTNWFARHHIWSHFDSFLHGQGQDG